MLDKIEECIRDNLPGFLAYPLLCIGVVLTIIVFLVFIVIQASYLIAVHVFWPPNKAREIVERRLEKTE